MAAPVRGHLLESWDPVRSGAAAAGRSVGGEDAAGLARVQVLHEALAALSLGRTLVVPSTVALDSRAFLSLHRVLHEASPTVPAGRRPPPLVVPHVVQPGAVTLDDVLRRLVLRAGDADEPFASSSVPWLSACDAADLAATAADLDRLHARLDDEHSEELRLVRSRLGTATRWPAAPRAGGGAAGVVARLGELAAADGGALGAGEAGARLAAALRALGPDVGSTLRQRSRLRSGAPWPGDERGRPVVEVVGGERELALVVELVDTLYTAVVADSVGPVPVTWSTALAADDELAAARRAAQRLALGARGGAPGTGEDDGRAGRGGPHFDVVLDGGDTARSGLLAALRGDLEAALGQVVAARAETGSPFWRTARGLDAALAAGDGDAARRALEEHVDQLSRVLGGPVRPSPDGRGGFRLDASTVRRAAPLAGAAAFEALSTLVSWELPVLAATGAAALLSAGDALAPRAAALPGRAARRRRLARALGEVLVLGEGR
ncbi:hypothetical protein WDZ16_00365 [Pseudokineococcus marinus]|uniref:hypothetical protein n=1 Tax=Pseudokineococcus marinus TaxID=351215 RepID=UPI0030B68195